MVYTFFYDHQVNKSFGEKRKMLRNSLVPLYPQDSVIAALAKCGLSETARAQELTVYQFISLYKILVSLESDNSMVSLG